LNALPTVTLDEALSELGIDRSARAEEARRAYLRLVKTRKPETDPEGFRRAREAYELTKEALEALAAGLPPATFEEPRPVPAPAPASPAPAATPRPQPPPIAVSGGALDIPTPDEIRHLLEARQLRRATEGLTRVYDAASRSVQVEAPPVPLTIQVLLALHEGGHFSTAEPLRMAAQRWLDASGGEMKLLDIAGRALWKIVSELATFGGELSDDVRVSIVRLAQGEPWVYALARLQALQQSERATAARDAAVLVAHPNLPSSQAIAAVLRGDEDAPPPVVKRDSGLSLRGILWGLVLLALFAGGIANSCEQPPPIQAVIISPAPTTSAGPTPARAQAMSLAAAIVLEANRENAAAPVQRQVEGVQSALDADNCAASIATMGDLLRALAVDGSAGPRLESNIDQLAHRVRDACRPDASIADTWAKP
jgi:hypothetical protein